MACDGIQLGRGALRAALAERTRQALACGALRPIATRVEVVEDGGVRFIVRRVSSLADKAALAAAPGSDPARGVDPFLPPDPALVVADVSDTHVAVLNKFPVLERHLLLVTRAFVHQEVLIDTADFAALAACLVEIDGLAFYNGGRTAGASQDHKHLQLVPLPLDDAAPALPIEPLLEAARPDGARDAVPGLPFAHAFARLDPALFDAAARAGRALGAAYARLLVAAGIGARPGAGTTRQSRPYNLLATRRWMLLVPRALERFDGLSVNALGFAGSLFVRDDAEMERLRRAGPMAALRGVAGPRATPPPR